MAPCACALQGFKGFKMPNFGNLYVFLIVAMTYGNETTYKRVLLKSIRGIDSISATTWVDEFKHSNPDLKANLECYWHADKLWL
jgi:hypothetical protein